MKPLAITGCGSISPLGSNFEEVRASYRMNRSSATEIEINRTKTPVYPLSSLSEDALTKWEQENNLTDLHHDRVTRLSLFAAAHAVLDAGWKAFALKDTTVIVSSARGATASLETLHAHFLEHERVPPHTSPNTTIGGIASAVASFLGSEEAPLGTSMVCTSSMQSLLILAGLIGSGRISRGIVCGSEAPLTPFTIAQMKALRIYSTRHDPYPCRPIAKDLRTNKMVLGEGSCALTLEDTASLLETGAKPRAYLLGIGTAREAIHTATGMEPSGEGLEKSMQRALADANLTSADAIVVHAPGTKLGNSAECAAISRLFPNTPPLFSTKHLTGHTFGASGALGIELALLLLSGERPVLPYEAESTAYGEKEIKTVLVNTAGFGGVIASAVIGSSAIN